MKSALGLLSLSACYVLLSVFLAPRFPPLNPDESIIAVHGDNMIHGRGHRYSLYDDVFPPTLDSLRDANLEITRPVYDLWIGLWLTLGRTMAMARASSWAAGLLALLAAYGLGTILRSPSLGLLMAALTAAHPIFILAGCLVRPELMLLAVCGIFFCGLFRPPRRRWAHYALGALAGLSIGIHPNAVAILAGELAVILYLRPERLRGEPLFQLVGGFLMGFLAVLGSIDFAKYQIFRQTILYQLVRMPLLSASWKPTEGLQVLRAVFLRGDTYYLNTALAPGWTASLTLSAAAALLAAASAVFTGRRLERGFLIGLAVCMLVMMALDGRAEVLYVLTPLPFLIPIIGLTLASAWESARVPLRAAAAATAGLLGASIFIFFIFVSVYRQRSASYESWMAQLHSAVPDSPGLKVLGPVVLWFAFPSDSFRDVEAFRTARPYLGDNLDIGACLHRWRPDIFITDKAFRHIFLHEDASDAALTRLLHLPARSLGRIDTGGSHGVFEIYRMGAP